MILSKGAREPVMTTKHAGSSFVIRDRFAKTRSWAEFWRKCPLYLRQLRSDLRLLLLDLCYRRIRVNLNEILEINSTIRNFELLETEALARDILRLSTVEETIRRLLSATADQDPSLQYTSR